MTSMLRSAALPAFEETRPAPYWTGSDAPSTGPTATLAPAAPLPQDSWLIDLPEIEPEPAPVAWLSGWRWPRIAGLAVAALLTLFALGLAASLLDAQHRHGPDGGMRFAGNERA